MTELTIFLIVGMGHSGSTLTSCLLGAHPNVVNFGEIEDISKHIRARTPRSCGCGHEIGECSFWRQVNDVLGEEDLTIPAFPGAPVDMKDADKPSILKAAARVAAADAIVDSSKYPSRLPQLEEIKEFNVIPIFIYSRPHKFIYSYIKKYNDSLFKRSFMYNYISYSIVRLVSRTRKEKRKMALISYEELAERPEETLRKMTDRIGLSYHEGQMAWSDGVFHSVAGNRMRFAGNEAISKDDSWRDKLSATKKLAILILCLPGSLALWILSKSEH